MQCSLSELVDGVPAFSWSCRLLREKDQGSPLNMGVSLVPADQRDGLKFQEYKHEKN